MHHTCTLARAQQHAFPHRAAATPPGSSPHRLHGLQHARQGTYACIPDPRPGPMASKYHRGAGKRSPATTAKARPPRTSHPALGVLRRAQQTPVTLVLSLAQTWLITKASHPHTPELYSDTPAAAAVYVTLLVAAPIAIARQYTVYTVMTGKRSSREGASLFCSMCGAVETRARQIHVASSSSGLCFGFGSVGCVRVNVPLACQWWPPCAFL